MSESSVKRWVDDGAIAADRTAGGHRRIPLAAAIRFIRRQRSGLAKPDLLPLDAPPRLGVIDATAVDALEAALQDDQPLVAKAILTGRFLGGASIASIGDELIRPVLKRIGELWRDGPEGILLEHRAVDSCIHALVEMGSWLPTVAPSAPAGVTAGAPDDPYLLPPMLASLVLREAGIRAHNLGPATPLEALEVAMHRYGARLCCISVSEPSRSVSDAAWQALADAATGMNARIVVGGRSCGLLSVPVRDRVRCCGGVSELALYAAGWLELSRPHSTSREDRP